MEPGAVARVSGIRQGEIDDTPSAVVRWRWFPQSRVDPESKEVCRRYDSDATEGVQHEKVGISCD